MKKSFFVFVLGMGLLGQWSEGVAWAFKIKDPKTELLDNGLQLVWFLDDRLPLVDFIISSRGGTTLDPVGKSGTTEIMTMMMGRSAGGLSPFQIDREVQKLGASRFINGGDDLITLGIHGLAKDSERLFEILKMTALEPALEQADFDYSKKKLLAYWQQIGDRSQTLTGIAFHRAMTSGTIYSRGSVFRQKQLESVQIEDVRKRYRLALDPRQSVLLIVGKADYKTTKKMIESALKGWKGQSESQASAAPQVKHQVLGMAHERHPLVVHRSGGNQAQVMAGFVAPLRNHPDHYSLMVANVLLGGYFNSRLNGAIRDDMGLAYGVGSSFSYLRDLGMFSIGSATQYRTVGQFLTTLMSELRLFSEGDIAPDEVEKAKNYLLGSFPLATATLGSIARFWLKSWKLGIPFAELRKFQTSVQGVDQPAVIAAVKKHFDLKKMIVVIGGDSGQIVPEIKKLSPKEFPYRKPKVIRLADIQ